MKLYITDDETRGVAIADNIEEAAELLFITEPEDEVESITPSNGYYRVRVRRKYGYGWVTTDLVNEYEIENHKVYD